MYKGMYVAASGAMAAQRRLDTLTNNLANVSTPGFKADQLVFESFLAESEKTGPAPTEKALDVSRARHSEYVAAKDMYSDFSQGPIRETGNPLDVALEGDGFLAVMTYEGERYTRNGSLRVGPGGELVTSEGHMVLSEANQPVYLGLEPGPVTIDENGYIWTQREDEGNVAYQEGRGRLKLVDFEKPYELTKEGSGLYRAQSPEAALTASDVRVWQGRLEGSNVNIVRQMTGIIQNQRAAETYQKAIQESDNMTTQLILQVGRAAS
ncbi:MAG: flagellar basal-body rod protein FlgF [Candidatus Nitrospinota bacterium M3_3B_026]